MSNNHNSRLALFGGEPIHKGTWPKWPVPTESTMRMLQEVCNSGRWAISGAFTGATCFEKRFSQAFAQYHNVPYAVPTVNGSAALTIAMEALGIGAGDEVIVPGLTWVAVPSAVAKIGAVPIIVDVEPDTLCISKEAVKKAMTDRTKGILVVHAYCSCADIDGFLQLSKETGIPLIEDCSQANGAEWNGQKVGTFGVIGTFSMQQTKVLTCGEGGVNITRSPELYDRMQQLRADGRRYIQNPVVGQLELEEVGSVHGHNYCLSEFHAAVALSQLELLEQQTELRARNASFLSEKLNQIPGISTISAPPKVTRRSYYDYAVRLDPKIVGLFSASKVVEALTAELNVFVEMLDTPLNNHPLYDPLKSARLARTPEVCQQYDPKRFDLPVATQAHRNCVAFLHHALLGSKEDMMAIVAAFEKIVANIEHLNEPPK